MRSIVVWLIGILLLPGWMGHLYARTYADGYVGYAAGSPVGYIDGA